MFSARILKLAAPIFLVSAISASASTVDFTVDFTTDALATTATGFSGSVDSFTYTLDGSPSAAIKGDTVAADAVDDLAGVGLAGDFDGIGIDDDEVGQTEFLTLTFDREIKITGAFFLDLFISKDGLAFETASISNGINTVTFDAYSVYPVDGGYGAFRTSIKGTVFKITESSGNDNIGQGDVALAGLTIAPVPLPAGFLLLGTALGGLGFARRRKTKATQA